ncbi:MAG: type III PLP-dependent enzyme [Pseudomonadota bacterium]
MERYQSARHFLSETRPERPVFGVRPHAAARAARYFLTHFPGEVAYAYKANSSVFLLGALYGAGIRHFDVASLPELEDAATIPDATLHFMHPVKSRNAIRRAYHEFGIRRFAVDSHDELEKIMEETGRPDDLHLYVRLSVPAHDSSIPLERKFGVEADGAVELLQAARQCCDELGLTFHVGSQTATTEAYVNALKLVRQVIVKAGVVIDALDVGGGFPARYDEKTPTPLKTFFKVIEDHFEGLPVSHDCRLVCEPGRALVAEAESLIVRVNARRGNELFINDGGYGALFDATHFGFSFPVRLVRPEDVATPHQEQRLEPFELWGPTCDSVDYMKGPFLLPPDVREGDYLEFGNMGAYGRAIAGTFNGYGQYDEIILDDAPMYTMFDDAGTTTGIEVRPHGLAGPFGDGVRGDAETVEPS